MWTTLTIRNLETLVLVCVLFVCARASIMHVMWHHWHSVYLLDILSVNVIYLTWSLFQFL